MVFMIIRLIWGALVRNRRKSSEYYVSITYSANNGSNEIFSEERLNENTHQLDGCFSAIYTKWAEST